MLNCKLYITVHAVAKGGRKLIISLCWMQGVGALHLDCATFSVAVTWDRAQCDKEKWSTRSPPN